LHVGDLAERTAWLRARAEPGAIVMSEYPQTDFLYGGRSTVPYPAAAALEEPEKLAAYLVAQRVDYVLVAPELRWAVRHRPTYSRSAQAVLDRVAELDTSLERVHVSPEHQVFRFKGRLPDPR
jgi:hypothetical protein